MEIVEIEEVKEEDNDIPITPGVESTLVIKDFDDRLKEIKNN